MMGCFSGIQVASVPWEGRGTKPEVIRLPPESPCQWMSVKLPSVATTVGSPRPESRARCVPFHPTLGLAFIPTASLVLAFALAAYFNHLVLIPGYWDARRYGTYAATLLVTMALPTAAALAVIRTSYVRTLGPD